MHAALNLVSLDKVTHTAVRNGDWHDPGTWESGKIPSQDSKVHIPNGITVTYGEINDIRHDTVRVDGVLDFATSESSKLLLDTMVITAEGELIIGQDRDPIKSNQSIEIVFSSNTDIDPEGDPSQLRRGLLSMGKVTVIGANKLDHIKLKQPALKGDSVLELDLPPGQNRPRGWRVGDRLVLGGTQYNFNGSDSDNTRFQDEVLEITEINGSQIRFRNLDITDGDDTQLRFDHRLPDLPESEELSLYVANTSRNITFRSEDGQDTALERRGHIMLMQNPNVVVKNAGFLGLGRSDKSRLVDDPGQNVDGSVGTGTNPRGRYALHLHRMINNTLEGSPAILSGNAIVGSPGWGIVAHSSKAKITDNVVFDVAGAGIVAEGGNEQGSWINNIVIKTTGINRQVTGRRDNDRARLFDFGFHGDAYWIQGAAQVELKDNIAISSNDTGLSIFGDSLEPDRDFRDANTIAVSDLPPELRGVAPAGQEYVDVTDVPLKQLDGFTSYNARIGLRVWGHLFNADGEAEFNSSDPRTAHALRSQVSNFKLWGNTARGLQVQYSSQIDFDNGIILGTSSNNRSVGVASNDFAFNNTFNNLTIKQFNQGFKVPFNGSEGAGNDYLQSTLSNSILSDNAYHLGKTNQAGSSNAVDDFPSYFELRNTQFSSQDNNQDPIANFSIQASDGLGIIVDAQQSYDLDPIPADDQDTRSTPSSGIAAYGWDFNNDGQIDATGRTSNYQFQTPGRQTISLTVWDSQGASQTLKKTFQIENNASRNAFLDPSFNQNQPYLSSSQAGHRWANQGWFASRNVQRDESGFAILSSPHVGSNNLGQVVKNDNINQGQQSLQFRLKNIEGAEPGKYWLHNEITIQLWGINGQFNNYGWTLDGPEAIGTLPMDATNLFSRTVGGRESDSVRESFDWRDFKHTVDLGQGYQFLLFQVNTSGTRDQTDFVAIDNISLSRDLATSAIEAGTLQDDIINGSNQNDILRGLRGNDRISGRAGKDRLIGGAGSDILLGGNGNDVLVGATRASLETDIDTLVGGAGSDRFILGNRSQGFYENKVLDGQSSFAWIKDFNPNRDQIQLHGNLEDYQLDHLTLGGAQGLGISLLKNSSAVSDNQRDLIGFIEGQTAQDLTERSVRYV